MTTCSIFLIQYTVKYARYAGDFIAFLFQYFLCALSVLCGEPL